MTRLNTERIKSLRVLLKGLDLEYTDEQAQEAGLQIMRFVLAKMRRQQELNAKENGNGREESKDKQDG